MKGTEEHTRKKRMIRITVTVALAAHILYMVDNFSVSYAIHKIFLEKRRFKKESENQLLEQHLAPGKTLIQ